MPRGQMTFDEQHIPDKDELRQLILGEWLDMPEFVQDDREAIKTIAVSFETEEDMQRFSELLGVTVTMKTKGIFYPQNAGRKQQVYVDEP